MANATVNNKNKKKIKIGQRLHKTKFIKVSKKANKKQMFGIHLISV